MNICIYGASARELKQEYFDAARELGRELAKAGHTLVFGGGREGLMGACANGAKEAGGRIIGIAPRFFDEPGILFKDCGEFIFTDTMRERKQLMEEKSEAVIMLPGGIGSFEEFFEMLTLKQLGRHNKPMVILNTLGYYGPMLEMLRHTAREGFMSEGCLSLYALADTPAQALEELSRKQEPRGSIRRLSDYAK